MNIKMQQAARYVENLIPFRDLTSMFLFEKSEDMHFFSTEVRERQGLIVNVGLAPTGYSLDSFVPPQPIDSIKSVFLAYLKNFVVKKVFLTKI